MLIQEFDYSTLSVWWDRVAIACMLFLLVIPASAGDHNRLFGCVTDANGHPVAHAKVLAKREEAAGFSNKYAWKAETDKTTGCYEMLNLPEGTYRVRLENNDYSRLLEGHYGPPQGVIHFGVNGSMEVDLTSDFPPKAKLMADLAGVLTSSRDGFAQLRGSQLPRGSSWYYGGLEGWYVAELLPGFDTCSTGSDEGVTYCNCTLREMHGAETAKAIHSKMADIISSVAVSRSPGLAPQLGQCSAQKLFLGYRCVQTTEWRSHNLYVALQLNGRRDDFNMVLTIAVGAAGQTDGSEGLHGQDIVTNPTRSTDYDQNQTQDTQMTMGVLAVTSDEQGTLFIDGSEKVRMAVAQVVTLKLVAGQHILELRGTTGQELWEKVVSVPANAQVVEQIAAHPQSGTKPDGPAGSTPSQGDGSHRPIDRSPEVVTSRQPQQIDQDDRAITEALRRVVTAAVEVNPFDSIKGAPKSDHAWVSTIVLPEAHACGVEAAVTVSGQQFFACGWGPYESLASARVMFKRLQRVIEQEGEWAKKSAGTAREGSVETSSYHRRGGIDLDLDLGSDNKVMLLMFANHQTFDESIVGGIRQIMAAAGEPQPFTSLAAESFDAKTQEARSKLSFLGFVCVVKKVADGLGSFSCSARANNESDAVEAYTRVVSLVRSAGNWTPVRKDLYEHELENTSLRTTEFQGVLVAISRLQQNMILLVFMSDRKPSGH
jgi:hypothetical protein